MATNPSAQAAYQRARNRVGIAVTFQRVDGQAPNTVKVSASITAIVRNYAPDSEEVRRTDYGAGKLGAITQGDRMVIVLQQDLIAQYFPLPVRKHDRILLPSGDVLDVIEVDANKRALDGAIELKAAGVQ